ncbi:hypothetical protein P3L10_016505 [Capsicum annuum]
MEVFNKKITSPFFTFLFISSLLLIQCFPYVLSQPLEDEEWPTLQPHKGAGGGGATVMATGCPK